MSLHRLRTVLRHVRAAISCPDPTIDRDGSYRLCGYPVVRRSPADR
jgi:hypothetical protein